MTASTPSSRTADSITVMQPGPATAPPATWLAAWLLLLPSAVAVWMAATILHDIPWGDQLTLFRDSSIAEGVSFESVFRFHNEHLIVPTKLAVAIDYWLWHGANLIPMACSLLLTLGIIAAEAWIFRRAAPDLSTAAMAFVAALLAAVLLNGRLTWTLTFPILFQHVSANFCVVLATAAFAMLAAGTSDHRGRAFAICLVAAGTAAISSASGIFALQAATAATLLLVALSPGLRHRPWRGPVGMGFVIGVGIIAAYAMAYGLATPGGGRPQPDFVQAVRFAIYFPGGAWFRDGTWPIVHRADPLLLHAVVLGFWLLVVDVAVRLWQRRNALGEFELFHVGLLVFVVTTAAVGGLFRGGLGDLEALNKKYPPTALLAWASLGSLVLRDRLGWIFASGSRGSLRPLAVAMVVVAAILPGDLVEFRAWKVWRDELEAAISSYAAGVRTDAVLLHFFPEPDQADRLLTAIEQDEGYWFRHRDGGVARAAVSLLPGRVGGRVDRVPDHTDYSLEFINETKQPLGKPPAQVSRRSGLRLAGWAVDREAETVPTAVELILDGTRYRCRSGLPRTDVAEYFGEPGFAAAGFECLLPPGALAPGEHRVKLWIVLADSEAYLETPTYRIMVE